MKALPHPMVQYTPLSPGGTVKDQVSVQILIPLIFYSSQFISSYFSFMHAFAVSQCLLWLLWLYSSQECDSVTQLFFQRLRQSCQVVTLLLNLSSFPRDWDSLSVSLPLILNRLWAWQLPCNFHESWKISKIKALLDSCGHAWSLSPFHTLQVTIKVSHYLILQHCPTVPAEVVKPERLSLKWNSTGMHVSRGEERVWEAGGNGRKDKPWTRRTEPWLGTHWPS